MADKTERVTEGQGGGGEVSIDDKGRIVIPANVRSRYDQPFAISRGPIGCLVVHSAAQWRETLDLVIRAPRLDPSRGTFERLVIGGAATGLVPDKQGRVLLPRELRSFARLKDRALLIGLTESVEIWSPENYEAYQNDPHGFDRNRREAIESAYASLAARQ
jgi:MraZ protein